MKKVLFLSTAILCLSASAALADETTTATSTTTTTTTTPAAAPAAPATPPTLMPSMTGPLAANATPFSVPTEYGPIYVGGVVSGLGLIQTHPGTSDQHALADLDNGAVIINKADGLVQFFLHIGEYSIPDIGTPYTRAGRTTSNDFGPLAEGYLKLAPTDNFSIEAGKLPTLIGNEYTYSFENMNIERGLLWNQENDVNRGVQANYTAGPVALSLSVNDGYYSDQYTWLWGSASWTINPQDSLTFVAGGNLAKDDKSTLVTPAAQNNSQLYNAYFAHSEGPWMLQASLQATHVPEYDKIGAFADASTYGGALYGSYKFDDKSPLKDISLPVRVEYIDSTGNASDGAPNLLYGQGSKAFSVTVTPTWQHGVFFVRPEASFVDAYDTVAGDAFGHDGMAHTQVRGLIETGIIF